MKVGSLFSGIGGFDLGFKRAGIETHWMCEIDKNARKVLTRHWPNVPIIEDVKNVTAGNTKPVDVIFGGFPCQDVSIAGRRAGLAGERSGLWHEFHRVLAEFRPQWAVIENVPGLLSSNGGADFATILHGLGELGYLSAWRVLDAQYFGLAQRRKRVFIVASLGDGRAAQILFERESLPRDTPPRREAGEGYSRAVAFSAGNSGESYGVAYGEEVTPPIRSGNSGTNQAPTVAGTLSASGSGTERPGGRAAELDFYIPISGTLGGGSGKRGWVNDLDRSGSFIPTISLALSSVGANSSEDGRRHALIAYGGNNTSGPIDVATTQNAHGGTGRHDFESETFITFTHEATPHYSDVPGALDAMESRRMSDAHSTGVRRLTPVECERLQGFPDGWTAFADDGKPQSDSTRYRQLGNAVAVPVAEWIARRILEATR